MRDPREPSSPYTLRRFALKYPLRGGTGRCRRFLTAPSSVAPDMDASYPVFGGLHSAMHVAGYQVSSLVCAHGPLETVGDFDRLSSKSQ